MAPVTIATQTAKDMRVARASVSFNVETVRDYLFGDLVVPFERS